MGKIKLNLVSGAVVEKPLINAFKANNNSYVVLDNEMNGSMGLPIILVCKLEQDKLIKILDQNEWSIVKEYLKNIIAGNQIEFIKINEEIAADDIYYTQLTLPVPSFDALKNAYKVDESSNESSSDGIMDMFNPTNVEENAVQVQNEMEVSVQPSIENVVNPVQEPVNVEPVVNNIETQNINMESPVIDIPINPVISEPVIEPTVASEPVTPITEPVVSPMDIVPPVMPEAEITPTPVVEPSVMNVQEPVIEKAENSIFREQKEAFMQACENMFDALVQKFERELENRK